MVPPQSLTLVFFNTSKLLPTCSYSSIQPFSHQVSAARCLFLGREKGEFRKKYARRKPGSKCVEVLAWWLLPGAGRCPAQAAASLQLVVPSEPRAEMLAAGRGCWLLAASLRSWVGVFQSNTKISIMLCHPKSVCNLLSHSSFPQLTSLCYASLKLLYLFLFAVRPLCLCLRSNSCCE